jgi:DNA polymerase, archaea type
MQDIRKLAQFSQYWKTVKGEKILVDRIDIDEDKIDIFDIARQSDLDNLRGYKPDYKIPDFDQISIVYLDIETYSNNSIVLQHFLNAMHYDKLYKNDRVIVNFICRNMEIDCDGYEERFKDYLIQRSGSEVTHLQIDYPDKDLIRDEILSYVADNLEELTNHHSDIDDRAALYPHKAIIALIGLMNEKGHPRIIDCLNNESGGIQQFFDVLEKKKPHILAHFNGFTFDLPFIIERCKVLRIKHPFYVSPHVKIHQTAIRNSKPQSYRDIWYNYGKTAVIDLYNQLLSWDYVARKLTKYDLKSAPIALGIRKDERINLSYAEMKDSIESGKIEILKEYLIYDLEDSKLLGDFLLPNIYYQKEWLPTWKLQSISAGGMGSKWNDFLIESYKKMGKNDLPKKSKKYEFEGGLTGAFSGIYKNVSKIDIESEYPHAMLLMLICSEKDTDRLLLSCLLYSLEYRLGLKKIAKEFKKTEKGIKANQRQGSEKIKINSAYGSLAVQGKEYNDYVAGAAVTAMGRAVLKYIIRELESLGAIICSYDTDGVFYTLGDFEENKEAWELINLRLPGTGDIRFRLDYEVEAETFYVPPTNSKITVEEEEDTNIFTMTKTGKKKNYIIVDRDGNIKCKGIYNKRDRSQLENKFTTNLILEYHKTGLKGARKYYQDIRNSLENRNYDVDLLSVTRKIKDNEKRLIELGIGEPGDVVKIWKMKDLPLYGKKGQILKKTEIMWTDSTKFIDYEFYINKIDGYWDEFYSFFLTK